MGFLSDFFGGKRKGPKAHYRPSKHDKIKAWAKTKDQAFWDAKKKR